MWCKKIRISSSRSRDRSKDFTNLTYVLSEIIQSNVWIAWIELRCLLTFYLSFGVVVTTGVQKNRSDPRSHSVAVVKANDAGLAGCFIANRTKEILGLQA